MILAPAHRGGGFELLRANTIANQDWSKCRLAVLAACSSTGTSGVEAGNPDSLVAAFARAGVPAIVASQWNVDSAATAALMREMYSHIADGERVPAALRQAILKVRKKPEWNHPFFWAGFLTFRR